MRLMFVGDISLGEHYFSFGHGPRTSIENGDYLFSNVHDVLNSADYVVGNLEGPISDAGAVDHSFESMVFRGHGSSADQLKSANINVVNLANNHAVQHGAEALDETVSVLLDQGIQPIGLTESESFIVGEGAFSCALIGMSAIADNTDVRQDSYVSFSLDALKSKLITARSKAAKVILILHWGDESLCQPSQQQRELAKQILEMGVDLIVGHHPHIFYDIERNDNHVVAYSLGDFVFDLPWDLRLTRSGILDIKIGQSGDLEHCLVWPIKIAANGTPKLDGKPVSCGKTEQLSLYAWSGPLNGQTIRKFAYFVRYFFKGRTKLKTKFLLWKIWAKISG